MTWCLKFHQYSFHSLMVLVLLGFKDRMQRSQDMGTHGVIITISSPTWGEWLNTAGSMRARKVEVSPGDRLYVPGGLGSPRVKKGKETGHTSPIHNVLNVVCWRGKRHRRERSETGQQDIFWIHSPKVSISRIFKLTLFIMITNTRTKRHPCA